MTDKTVFTQADQATTETPVVSAPSTTPVVPQELTELVGAGKKYQTVDEALKSVPHAQKHISTLEQELAAARDELTRRRTAEDLLADIQKGVTQQGTTTPKVDLSQEVVANIVQTALQQEKQKEVAKSNVQSVINSFTASYGEKAEEMFRKVATENKLSVSYLNALAATSPDAVARLAGLTTKPHSTQQVQGNINPLSLNTTQKQDDISGKVTGATTRDVIDAWQRCTQKVLNQQNKG